jgi:putative ABC transport system permease protein
VSFWRIIRVALRSLLAHPMRSILTMLGIIIGTACVIAIVSMGEGAERAMIASMTKMGANLLYVRPQPQRNKHIATASSVTLSIDDADAIREAFAARIVDLTSESWSSYQVKYFEKNVRTTVLGTTPSYEQVRNFPAAQGRYFTAEDVRQRRRVCVVGASVVDGLFAGEAPVGQQVKIKGASFDVVGVLQSKGESWSNPDDQVLIPITTAQRLVFGEQFIRMITIEVRSNDDMTDLQTDIEKLLRVRHKIPDEEEADFVVRNQQEWLDMMKAQIGALSLLLAGVGAVSLLVGGIGIMNIMLVSVTERTREIGIRKALGATRGDIVEQFLVEAIVTSAIGGAIGIGLGAVGSWKMAAAADWPFVLPPSVLALASGVSAGIGIVFGVFPALKAAWLDPIEALRYE